MMIAPWETDAERYGIGIARLLHSMPVAAQSAAQDILEKSLERGKTPLQTLEQLAKFNSAIADFGPPKKPRPKKYRKTQRQMPWGERCLHLEAAGVPRRRVKDLCIQALNEARQGRERTIREFADLDPDIPPAPNKAPYPVTEISVRRIIQRARLARGKGH